MHYTLMSLHYNIYVIYTVNAVGVTWVLENDSTGSKHVGQIYEYCKCCNAKMLECSALVGQILNLTNDRARYEQHNNCNPYQVIPARFVLNMCCKCFSIMWNQVNKLFIFGVEPVLLILLEVSNQTYIILYKIFDYWLLRRSDNINVSDTIYGMIFHDWIS
jgi:hypothetical protein